MCDLDKVRRQQLSGPAGRPHEIANVVLVIVRLGARHEKLAPTRQMDPAQRCRGSSRSKLQDGGNILYSQTQKGELSSEPCSFRDRSPVQI